MMRFPGRLHTAPATAAAAAVVAVVVVSTDTDNLFFFSRASSTSSDILFSFSSLYSTRPCEHIERRLMISWLL
jgi:hypothetical protein